MEKIKLSCNQIEELVLKIGQFFIGPKSEKEIIAMALEVTELSDNCPESRIRTIEEAREKFFKTLPGDEEEKSIAIWAINFSEDEDQLISVYREFLSIMIISGDDNILPNILAIRKMAEIMFK